MTPFGLVEPNILAVALADPPGEPGPVVQLTSLCRNGMALAFANELFSWMG
jgi:hypothetical protein